MRKLSICLLLALCTVAYAKDKQHKQKDKRFEPVILPVAEYAGVYRWSGSDHRLELIHGQDGRLHGTFIEMGRTWNLEDIRVAGANFTSWGTLADGTRRIVQGAFANRILNGETAFGARVYGVRVDGMEGQVNTFFPRVSDD